MIPDNTTSFSLQNIKQRFGLNTVFWCLLMLFQGSSLKAEQQTLLTSASRAPQHVRHAQGLQKPNIILVLLDDLGWGDVGYNGNTFVDTPTIDRLAHQGMVFTNAYSNAPNCAPSRAALISGLYAPRTSVYTMISGDLGDERLRTRLTPHNLMYLEPHFYTLAEMLSDAGYATANIGKWNLGTGAVRGPEGQGFDFNVAGYRGGHPHNGYFAPYDLPGLEDAPEGEYLTNRLNDEAIKFIEQNREHPFFIYLSHFAPHFPFHAEAPLIEKYRKKAGEHVDIKGMPEQPEYAAMIESVDIGLGRILDTLTENGLQNKTLIIFTSDNGGLRGYSWLGGYRGEKSLIYEGGIRVPMFWWWPEYIQPGKSDRPVMGMDIYSTLNDILQGHAKKLDGISLVSELGLNTSLSGSPKISEKKRDAIFWYFPAYVEGENPDASDGYFQQRPVAAIRKSDWKLLLYLDSDHVELYNLALDPGERSNIAKYEQEKTKALTTELRLWLKSMRADAPLPKNPAYNEEYARHYTHSWFDHWIQWFSHWLK